MLVVAVAADLQALAQAVQAVAVQVQQPQAAVMEQPTQDQAVVVFISQAQATAVQVL
jgi:hypothetical protein